MVKTVNTHIRKEWKDEFESYLNLHALTNYSLLEYSNSDLLGIQFYDDADAARFITGLYDVQFNRTHL